MHIPHSKKFYRLIESILKKLILFFKNTKNQKLTRAALSAIYLTHPKEQFLLKIQKNENFIVHCDELISTNIFVEGSFDFFKNTIHSYAFIPLPKLKKGAFFIVTRKEN